MKARWISSIAAALVAAAPTCSAADVTVMPGFDFTNVVVRVSSAPGAQFSLVDSANSIVASGASLLPASAYAYDVRLDGASVASGAFATGSDEAPVVGEWRELGGDRPRKSLVKRHFAHSEE